MASNQSTPPNSGLTLQEQLFASIKQAFPDAVAKIPVGALARVTGFAAITDDFSPAADVVEIRK